ncbi:hypothetical protein ACFE04_022249 [Oxalis oulophora]
MHSTVLDLNSTPFRSSLRSKYLRSSFISFRRTYQSPMSAVQPSEESVAMLVTMGFDQNSARQALVQARNDVKPAYLYDWTDYLASWLVEGFSVLYSVLRVLKEYNIPERQDWRRNIV